MTYPGGKGGAGVYQAIINQQPPHEVYIEPFLGSGAVMRAKLPAIAGNIGIDADRSVIEGFSVAGSRVKDPTLICGDARAWLRSRRWTGRELVYADPPYLGTSRLQQRRLYRYEMLAEAEHLALLATLAELPCMVQVSGYWSQLYGNFLARWRCVSFTGMTRGGPRTEFLWMNYPEPVALHDYSFLGEDFRERERIRRKAARWASRLRRQPKLERLALRSALLSADPAEYGDAAGNLAGSDDSSWRPSPEVAL